MASPTYEIPGEMRDFAEKSVDQARKAFEGFVGAAQKAAGQADESTASMTTNVRAVGSKAMGYAETNIRAAFDHAQKLVRAKDMTEVMSLQSEFLRAQMANMQEQAKEIGSSFQSAAKAGAQTVSDAAEQVTRSF